MKTSKIGKAREVEVDGTGEFDDVGGIGEFDEFGEVGEFDEFDEFDEIEVIAVCVLDLDDDELRLIPGGQSTVALVD